MSLVKAVPNDLKDRKCKRITLHKSPPVPYVPKKDIVQETVSDLKNNQSLKTQIGEGAELHLPICHSRMCKAFLMHVGWAMDAIENTKKPMGSTWSNPTWQSRQKPLWLSLMNTLVRGCRDFQEVF
jgi:hypothetical protein